MTSQTSPALDALRKNFESMIMDPSLRPLLAILKSARNGAVYGAKVRFPHALVMVFLFRSGTFQEKIKLVAKATRQHARNLATFAAIYKSCMLILRLLNPMAPGKEGPYDTFFSGLVGGYYVFGKGRAGSSSVNQQIVIYVFARVVLALARLSLESPKMTASTPTPTLFTQRLPESTKQRIRENAWPVFASLSWAMVMYIFRYQPESIQSSLRSSMKYMYVVLLIASEVCEMLIELQLCEL
jgi:peroxisomal membrane protein 4